MSRHADRLDRGTTGHLRLPRRARRVSSRPGARRRAPSASIAGDDLINEIETALTMAQLPNLRHRRRLGLWDELMETAKIGATAEGVASSASPSPTSTARCATGSRPAPRSLGCTVTHDRLRWAPCSRGSAGPRRADPPIGFGSHLDTQPTGGKFDGVLGVLGGARDRLRARAGRGRVRDLRADRGDQLDQRGRRALPSPRWSRPGCSRARSTSDWAYGRAGCGRHDRRAGARVDRLSRAGAASWRPSAFGVLRAPHRAGHRSLEAEDQTIGIVTGIQGIRWFAGDDPRAGRAHRRDADAPAQERAARCRASGRARQRDRARPSAASGRDRRAARGQAELA